MRIKSLLPSCRGAFRCAVIIETFVCLFVCLIRFFTALTKANHWFLSRAKWIHCKHTHPIILRSILLLFSHLCLYLPSYPFPSGFPSKSIHAYYLFSMRTTLPANLIFVGWFGQTNNYWWAIQIMKLLIMQFPSFFLCFCFFFLSFLVWQLLHTHCICIWLLLHFITLNDTHTHTHTHSVGFPWIRDRPVAEAPTYAVYPVSNCFLHLLSRSAPILLYATT